MDEKLKRLEAMRAAREAKQQLAKKFAQSVTSPVSSGALGSARDGPSSPVYGGSSTQEMASPTVPEMATVAGTRPLAASLDGSRLAPSAMPEEGTPKFAVDGYALLRALPLRQSMGSADEEPRSALKGAISGTLGEECGVCTTQLVFGDNTCSSTAVSIGLLPYGGGVSSALASTAPTAVAIVSAYSARRCVESIEKERAAPYFPWGYPVGSRSPTHQDLASAPGCVMAWVIVPLPSSYVDEQTGKETPADPRAPTSMVVHIPLVCEEEVTAVRLHPFRPGWVLGGTVHGQVVGWNLCHEWDSLSPRQLLANAKASTGNEQTLRLAPQCPSSCSFPSHEAHQGAVLSLEVLGTSSVHTLHSVSEDGWVCEWSSTQPMVLSHSTKARKVKVKEDAWGQQVMGTVACFVQHPGSSTLSHFFLGTARGYLLEGRNDAAHSISLDPMGTVVPAKGQSHGVDEAKVELVEMRQDGSITSIAVQSHSVAYRDCELVVTAATDGSCFLWFPESARHLEGFSSSVSCLAWSPTHSSVFAAGDVAGVVTLWNVHESVVAPKWSISLLPPGMHTGDSTTVVFRSARRLDEGGKASLVTEEKEKKKKDLVTAITSLTFSENGKVLIAGSASGCLHILELSSTELFDG